MHEEDRQSVKTFHRNVLTASGMDFHGIHAFGSTYGYGFKLILQIQMFGTRECYVTSKKLGLVRRTTSIALHGFYSRTNGFLELTGWQNVLTVFYNCNKRNHELIKLKFNKTI